MNKISLKSPMLLTLAASIVFSALIAVIPTTPTSALSGSQFNAGRIVDDGIFFDNTAMSATQVQQFLNAKVPTCDTNGTQPIYGTTRGAYGTSQGNPPPYTCLKDYSQTVPGIVNSGSDLCGGSISGGTKSSAQIIHQVAQACGINPQVLLVLLQKEQSLITDDWPWARQYEIATGYGCPDTAPCASEYYGFFNQVYQAAKAYRRYEANPNSYNYKAARNNYIYYHPSLGACGGSTVFIDNQATANMYIYTPYQPNASALNNLYGSGDSCGAYGNRNFWRMFNDWFGTTLADGYVAQFAGQSSYPAPAAEGQARQVYVRFKNLGSARWYDSSSNPEGISPVRLAATQPINRVSPFRNGWFSYARPTEEFSAVYESNGTTLASSQHATEPGQIVEFTYNLTVPWGMAPGTYREHFQPVLEGASQWSMTGNNKIWFDVTVLPSYGVSYYRQAPYPNVPQNSIVDYYVDYKNTGIKNLRDSAHTSGPSIYLSTAGPVGRSSTFSSSWPANNRPTNTISKVFEADGKTLAADQTTVAPGQIGRFEFKITTPLNAQTKLYREFFQPRMQGTSQQNIGGFAWADVHVWSTTHKASFHSQSAYPTLNKGATYPSFLQYKNTGTSTWYDNASRVAGIFPTRLAASNQINRLSAFSNGWPNAGRPNQTFTKVYESNGTTLARDQHIVNPGQIGRFEFLVTAPWGVNGGVHREFFQPVLDGSNNWNIGALSWLDIKVNN